MRKLKFRAWSIGSQSWIYFGINNVPGWAHPYEVEQFTGLYDKNGNEIYEGDIVEIESKSYGKYLKAIIYEEDKAGFIVSGLPLPKADGIQLEMPEREWEMEHMPCNCDGAMYEGYSALHNKFDMEKNKNVANVVVRGNIHENPELLEEK